MLTLQAVFLAGSPPQPLTWTLAEELGQFAHSDDGGDDGGNGEGGGEEDGDDSDGGGGATLVPRPVYHLWKY